MINPYIETLVNTIYDLKDELSYETRTRKDAVKNNYILSKSNHRYIEALEYIVKIGVDGSSVQFHAKEALND